MFLNVLSSFFYAVFWEFRFKYFVWVVVVGLVGLCLYSQIEISEKKKIIYKMIVDEAKSNHFVFTSKKILEFESDGKITNFEFDELEKMLKRERNLKKPT